MKTAAVAASLALIGTIVLANWLTSEFGLIPSGFGLLVTAGTYSAGLALALRDVVHETGGVRWVIATIIVGCAVSYFIGSGRIAAASAAAFLLAELSDFAVYSPLRRRQWHTAVVASNLVGSIIDSFVFLSLAGFPLTVVSVGGQILVKAVWVTGSFLLIAEVVRRARRQRT